MSVSIENESYSIDPFPGIDFTFSFAVSVSSTELGDGESLTTKSVSSGTSGRGYDGRAYWIQEIETALWADGKRIEEFHFTEFFLLTPVHVIVASNFSYFLAGPVDDFQRLFWAGCQVQITTSVNSWIGEIHDLPRANAAFGEIEGDQSPPHINRNSMVLGQLGPRYGSGSLTKKWGYKALIDKGASNATTSFWGVENR